VRFDEVGPTRFVFTIRRSIDGVFFEDVIDGLMIEMVIDRLESAGYSAVAQVGLSRAIFRIWSTMAGSVAGRPTGLVASRSDVSNVLAMSCRCQRRIVSGVKMLATESSALRLSFAPSSASVIRCSLLSRGGSGSGVRDMRFSATRYSTLQSESVIEFAGDRCEQLFPVHSLPRLRSQQVRILAGWGD